MKKHHFILGIIVAAAISLTLIIGCGNATGGGGGGGGAGLYSLTLDLTTEGFVTTEAIGTVEVIPAGRSFSSGTILVLTAEATSHYAFSSWEGDLTGSVQTRTVTIDANKSITACFCHHFTDNGDNTITDNRTGLMWIKNPALVTGFYIVGGFPKQFYWDGLDLPNSASAACASLNYVGHTDWRLPTLVELQTIVDNSRTNPSIDPTYFPSTQSLQYWSSTADDSNPGNYYYVDFSNGTSGSYGAYTPSFVRPVRSP